jgi:hypothetical protein
MGRKIVLHAVHVTCMVETRNAYWILDRKPERKSPLMRRWYRRKDIVVMDIK